MFEHLASGSNLAFEPLASGSNLAFLSLPFEPLASGSNFAFEPLASGSNLRFGGYNAQRPGLRPRRTRETFYRSPLGTGGPNPLVPRL